MEIAGIPLHPLVVHAVVVLTPLAGLVGVAYAAVPRWRWLLRWPLVALGVVAAAAAVVAAASGQSLLEARDLGQLETVRSHRSAGLLLRNVLLPFSLVTVLAAWRLGGPSALASGRGQRPVHGGAVDLVVAAVLGLGSLVLLALVVRAGHTGAVAVWS
jgi:uncharacterized membrane protein